LIGQNDVVIDPLDYEHRYATVVDAIRYGVSGVGPPDAAAAEALARLSSGDRPLQLPAGLDEARVQAVIANAVERGASGELSDDEVVHVALAGMRDLGVPIGPRPPEDPFPEL